MNTHAMTFKTSYHSRKSVKPIKSYGLFSRTMYSWECEKKMQNWSTLPRNFSATAVDKNSRLVPKLVLRHVLFGNNGEKQPASRKKGALH
jgi:hypothetical protein